MHTSTENQQEDFEATVLLESYNLVAITEIWWDKSHHWSMAVDGYDFNHPDISWKSSTASCRQSRRLLECIKDNFLIQVTESPTRADAILDLLVTSASKLISDIKIGSSLGCSDHALVEFTVLRDTGQSKTKVRTLNFRKANFQLFKQLVNRILWETVLRDKGAEQSWQIFRDAFHRAKELLMPRCNKSGKEGKRPAWLSQELLVKLKDKKEMQKQWKQGKSIGTLPSCVGMDSARPRHT